MSSDKEERSEQLDHPHETNAISIKQVGGWIAASLATMAGWMGAEVYMTTKLRAFDAEVAKLTRQDIMASRSAGLADGLGGMGMSGAGHNSIREAHYMDLIQSGKHQLASDLHNWGGRGTVAMATAMGAGVLGYILYKMVVPKDDPKVMAVEAAKSYSKKIAAERENPKSPKEESIAEEKMPTKHELAMMEKELEKKKEMVEKWEDKMSARKESAEHAASPSLSA